jgi:5'-3' exonuclease
VQVHLVDGTYELFRHYFARPSERDVDGREVAAVRGVVASMFGMVTAGTTHIGIATDHVIESFRNGLWRGYKTSAGVPKDLLSQFPILEETLTAAGFVVCRWWSSRPTMRLLLLRRLPRPTPASNA